MVKFSMERIERLSWSQHDKYTGYGAVVFQRINIPLSNTTCCTRPTEAILLLTPTPRAIGRT